MIQEKTKDTKDSRYSNINSKDHSNESHEGNIYSLPKSIFSPLYQFNLKFPKNPKAVHLDWTYRDCKPLMQWKECCQRSNGIDEELKSI